MKVKKLILAFNRGIVSRLGLARFDVERLAMSAETVTNWMPRILGSMMLRPGLEHVGETHSNLQSRSLGAIYNSTDTARLEFTNNILRVWFNDVLVTRPSVTASIANGAFTSDLASWTDEDESGTTSSWDSGQMALLGDNNNYAIREQEVTITNTGTLHALRIVIARGPVMIRVGSTSGNDDFIAETSLGTGTHSLGFVPTGNAFVRFFSSRRSTVLVDSVAIEASGVMTLPTEYATADLHLIRERASADVLYLACKGRPQFKVERRDNESWSMVEYLPENGPFRVMNTGPISIAPSAIVGDITLTANKSLFKSGHVGALFRLESQGQTVTAAISAENVFTGPIRVAGAGDSRVYSIVISGLTGTGSTVTVQYAYDESGPWLDSTARGPYTSDISTTHNDNQDNQVIYRRLGVKTGDYSTGTITCVLNFSGGSIAGVARVTGFTSATVVDAVVLKALGNTDATKDWREGIWSDLRGHPSAVTLYEGRTWWGGQDRIIASESDAYESFSPDTEGDAGTISRTIGSGPIQDIHWLLPLGRMLMGTALNSANLQAQEINGNNVVGVRSSSFDEPLSPTNTNLKTTSPKAVFVDRAREKLYELTFREETTQFDDYSSNDLSKLAPDLNEAGICCISVQHKPDLRIHCVRDDGTVAILIFDDPEEVTCWVELETDGLVEDVCVLPGEREDSVYYTVNRGGTRSHEKWAEERECRGGTLNKQADSFYLYSGSSATTITVPSRFTGKSVVVWGNGKDLGTHSVSGTSVTLSEAVTSAVIGLPYQAKFKSARLTDLEGGAAPNERRIVQQIGLTLAYVHTYGLQYGPELDRLYDLPLKFRGRTLGDNEILVDRDDELTPFGGSWDADSRIWLVANAPKPCTVLAATMNVETSEK